jgi:proteic killer suppression protein
LKAVWFSTVVSSGPFDTSAVQGSLQASSQDGAFFYSAWAHSCGCKSGIQAIHANRLKLILAMLDQADVIEDMDAPGLRLHQLKGNKNDYWSVTVQANWRMIFSFDAGNAYVVNYLDYH